MLTEQEKELVQRKALESEVRSLYFAELAAKYTKIRQIISGVTFFLSSGAASTLAAKLPSWIPLLLSTVLAVLTAYSLAVSLDRKVTSLSKLHSQWNHIQADFEMLLDHFKDDDANDILQDLQRRCRDASENGLEMPYNEHLIQKWTTFVVSRGV